MSLKVIDKIFPLLRTIFSLHLLFIVSLVLLFFGCEDSPKSSAKKDILSIKFVIDNRVSLSDSTEIDEHNKLQNKISIYRKTYNDALALYKGKKFLDSVNKFEQAINIYFEADTYYNYGKSLSSIGKFREAIKAYEISDRLGYENKVNLYYNIACAYSLLNETEATVKYLRLSILKGFKYYHILEKDSSLSFIRKHPKWGNILLHISSENFLTKNPKEFLINQTKKIKLKSNSKTILYGSKEADSDNIEVELFDGLAFYKEEFNDKDGYHSVITREGTYKIKKDSLQIELKKGKKESNHPTESLKSEIEISNVEPISFELIYKDTLKGFMKDDFVILGDDDKYALDKKICAYVKDEDSTPPCEECKKQYEQKGYFCAY